MAFIPKTFANQELAKLEDLDSNFQNISDELSILDSKEAMTYPAAGIAISLGSSWGTSLSKPAGNLVGTTAVQTLTSKTINLSSNTLVATSAQLRTAVTDETGTGSLVFATSPSLVGPITITGDLTVTGTLNTALVQFDTVVQTSDLGTGPNEVPLNQYLGELAYLNKDQFAIRPQTSVEPNGIGELTMQLTNNSTLVIKVKGSDGVIRSTTLTLS